MSDWKPGAIVMYKNIPKYVLGVCKTRPAAGARSRFFGAAYVKSGDKTYILIDFPAAQPLGSSALKTA